MKKNIFLTTLILSLSFLNLFQANAAIEDYSTLRDIDKGTFNEYRYLMVKEYFKLKENFEVKGTISKSVADKILSNAKVGYNYLPDSLKNQNYYNDLKIAIEKGLQSPNSEVAYEEIIKKLDEYIEKVLIQKITGLVEVSPNTGNAPLTTTFRGKVTDPSGTIIPSSNYIWWFDNGGIKRVIGRGASINYTFRDEGNFSVFLDVKSNHKNNGGYTDILPFSSRGVVEVKEKVASIIININSVGLRENDEIKFTPEESNYGLIFDATNSTPTGGAKFRKTEWTFGNGVSRTNDGSPKVERVVYSKEGNYPVVLKLTTNEGKTIERKFVIAIHKPIATIQANKDDGFIGEKFVFSARPSVNDKNLSYSWNIIDISNDKILTTKNGNVLNYDFKEKGRYNIQLNVKDAQGNNDTDTKIIYINSRAPIAEFIYSIPDSSKPNKVLFDGSRSYDPDYSDDGKLKYNWMINGEKIEIDSIDSKGAIGYYTFDSIGDHSVTLEVVDPDDMSSIKTQKVKINSTLSLEFVPIPRVAQRDRVVRFSVISPNAKYFEWDFGDGTQEQTTSNKMSHRYEKSGMFNAKLTVKDKDGKSNFLTKTVYISESDSPYAAISVDLGGTDIPKFENTACNNGAYIVDKVKTINFKSGDSINVDGSNNGLSYTWKIGNDKYLTSKDASYKFGENGCFPIKLTVKSDKNGKTHSTETWVKVENLKPIFSSIGIAAQSTETDPVIISVSALGAQDPDGVIQSYLWYYYTDSDPSPQDFRMTSLPNTTFVIPKITGNYYFVVVMRDNSDARISSEEIDSNKYFISLAGDNINTPLADLKVDKNSVLIGEEIIFTTTVKNVLGQDITKDSEYAWDFDGDGFYDEETKTPNITYKFEKSGTFYSKLRIKYKGMTNVRTIEINVANILTPDFKYYSIGNTYVFFNTSAGKYDKVVWDMGDGNKIDNQNNFTYTYQDNKSSHEVSLKISEGTKTKTKTQEITKDLKEMMKAKNSTNLYMLSNQNIEDNTISLDQEQKVYIYLQKKDEDLNYAIDNDINIDSDLNGTKDDDIDNKLLPSYENAGIIEVILNDSKTQTFRIYTISKSGEIIDSTDIKIEKKYIKNEEINIESIKFDGITDDEKVKVEKLKTFIQQLPQEHRLKGMKYVQKLQEEWFYDTEKTKVILEFEGFIDEIGVSNKDEINSLLESFLVNGAQDQSLRNMAYTVVKNLIPKEIVEYDKIIEKLDNIKSNPDKLEQNKVLGKEILEMIKDTSLISNEDKLTIKTQLQVFIYGAVDNIPKEIVNEVSKEDSSNNKFIGLLSGVSKVIGLIFLGVILIIIAFFIWFKLSNKNKNQGLQDFIIEKTSHQTGDILNESKTEVKEPLKVEEKKEDILEAKTPDWLNSTNTTKVEQDPLTIKSTPKVEEEKVPDWLSGNTQKTEIKEPLKTKEEKVIEKKEVDLIKDNALTINEENDSKIDKVEIETKIEEEKVPDWLKGVISEEKIIKEEIKEEKEVKKSTPKKEKIVEIDTEDLIQLETTDDKIPDWLKSTTDNSIATIEEVKETKEDKPKKTPTKTKKDNKEDIVKNNSNELWEDGMEIPDWLKGTGDENQSTGTNNNKTKDDGNFWTLDEADKNK
ncbi:PKD domain-containing protein [Candidatus Gracilibacteria bacterium]|nr:PKD domain-containing protein [Candidatus Gracilibacteria bacterium]